MGINNNYNDFMSTLPFVEFTFYNFASKTVLHKKSLIEMNVNI